jgi:hypothetical protein
MNMTKQTMYMIGALIFALIAGVVTLILFAENAEDVDRFINFASLIIIPTITALWAGNRADKAGQLAEKAAVSAEQAVQNTNGRMGELIQDALDNGRKIDTARYADVIEAQGIQVPPAFADFDVTKREES